MEICKVCKSLPATGPKIVGSIRSDSGVDALKTLLMCDDCYDKVNRGEIILEVIDESKN
jgi:hypothetical protein